MDSHGGFMRRGRRPVVVGAARSEGLVIQSVGEETLVYDLATHEAHCLSAAAARVWRVCDGSTTREQLSVALSMDADTVGRAVDELETCGLLEADGVTSSGSTRREMTIKAAKAGAVVAAAPLIWSVTGPVPEAIAGASQIAACGAYSTQGCGDCHKGPSFCCCCTPAGGVTKLCYPHDLCVATTGFGAQSGHCSTVAP
jgi:hypothetical protein